APSDLRAKTLARPWPELLPGLVTDWPGPDRPVARARQRQSWPKTVTGKILDADRQPLEGAGIVLDGTEHRTGPDGTFSTEAVTVGAQGPATLRDFDALMRDLKARGIYTIARIVAFKDNILATRRPDLAIIDTRTGQPWTDNEKLAWVDPFREEVWDYNLAIAREAAKRGFDEIQFDYVRLQTDGKLGAAKYAEPNNRETRLPVLAVFLRLARRELGPLVVYV